MKKNSHPVKLLLPLLLSILFTACNRDKPIPPIEPLEGYTTTKQYPGNVGDESLEDWKKELKDIEVVQIKSTMDGKVEPALFYASESSRKKPLLVLLHSWSSGYLQVPSIPFALWAEKYDWAFIQPNYRGIFEHPEAMASDAAIQDIVDAVDYAMQHADIDSSRVYLVGSSGGAMTALVTASRHPELWAGVAAWVPVFDIPEWYDFNLYYPHRKYNKQIIAALGGEPLLGTAAAAEGKRRSPSTHIHKAKDVSILLAHGINDLLVPPSHSIRAFNILAAPADTISKEDMEYIVKEQAIPENLQGEATDPHFGESDPEVVFSRESNNVKLVLYVGVHDMAYNSTLLWLNDQQKSQPQKAVTQAK
ncbi:prolyl oligopeptidase family serine peptidase [Pontibacter korlensis]|uniref:Dipeptidyl aminopeptidase n=1 Tax=Pontibacter korlensis TaxID=400092 RepID=A0A0E3ZDI2_9BACT|nr:prolyl oligopeptidase family serine peptidase [Pontibacter korlensis]AKD03250.1 dipeptidyl aminopeptidase [Pontibacter korlensis]